MSIESVNELLLVNYLLEGLWNLICLYALSIYFDTCVLVLIMIILKKILENRKNTEINWLLHIPVEISYLTNKVLSCILHKLSPLHRHMLMSQLVLNVLTNRISSPKRSWFEKMIPCKSLTHFCRERHRSSWGGPLMESFFCPITGSWSPSGPPLLMFPLEWLTL